MAETDGSHAMDNKAADTATQLKADSEDTAAQLGVGSKDTATQLGVGSKDTATQLGVGREDRAGGSHLLQERQTKFGKPDKTKRKLS